MINVKSLRPRCGVVKSRRCPSKAVRRLFAAFDGFWRLLTASHLGGGLMKNNGTIQQTKNIRGLWAAVVRMDCLDSAHVGTGSSISVSRCVLFSLSPWDCNFPRLWIWSSCRTRLHQWYHEHRVGESRGNTRRPGRRYSSPRHSPLVSRIGYISHDVRCSDSSAVGCSYRCNSCSIVDMLQRRVCFSTDSSQVQCRISVHYSLVYNCSLTSFCSSYIPHSFHMRQTSRACSSMRSVWNWIEHLSEKKQFFWCIEICPWSYFLSALVRLLLWYRRVDRLVHM